MPDVIPKLPLKSQCRRLLLVTMSREAMTLPGETMQVDDIFNCSNLGSTNHGQKDNTSKIIA